MNSSSPGYPSRKRRLPGLLFLALAVAGGWWLASTLWQQYEPPLISPLPEVKAQPRHLLSLFARQKYPDALRQKITEAVGANWNNYSIYVEDYSSNFTMGINETETFTAASVNKLPILAALYWSAQNGQVDLTQVITLQSQDIQGYGSGSIRYDPVGTAYSVQTLARLMMQKSDNTAAFLLGNYVLGLDKVQSLINRWGLTQTDMANNKTSNRDMALLLRKLDEEKVANHALTAELMSFLRNSDFEDRIPALLPRDAVVFHKTGNGVGNVHDVGIISHDKTRYYLGILTSDITDDQAAASLSARISKLVFDFMQ